MNARNMEFRKLTQKLGVNCNYGADIYTIIKYEIIEGETVNLPFVWF